MFEKSQGRKIEHNKESSLELDRSESESSHHI